MNLNEFVEDLHQSILSDLEMHGGNAEEIFVDRVCGYLADSGLVTNVQVSFLQKSSLGVKVNAYSYDPDEKRLSLFVAVHEMPYGKLQTISRSEIERTVKRCVKFFEYAAGGKLQDVIEEANRDARDLAQFIETHASSIGNLDVFLLTNCVYKSNEVVEMNVTRVRETKVQVWDVERLYQLVDEMQGVDAFTINFVEQYGQTFEMMSVPTLRDQDGIFDCYVGYIPGTLLAKVYKDLGQRIIERNVRSYLQAKGKVNKGIKDTLLNRPGMFIAYNNGISTTAEAAKLTQIYEGRNVFRVDSLTGWQIVNGGQTTASLHHVWELGGTDLSGVFVQAKLTVLKTQDDDTANDLISRISQYANTQNKISFSDLGANDSIHIQLQQVSRSIWAPDPMGRKSDKKWYYERARGQYLVDINRQPTRAAKDKFKLQNPKQQVITKTQLAKYYMTWEQMPHIVSRGNEENFTQFVEYMEEHKPTIDAEFFKTSIARGLIFSCCDQMVRKMDLPGYKANVVAYTVAMLAYAAPDQFPLLDIWNRQGLSPVMRRLIAETAAITWNYLSNPPTQGTNISQWCKKEDCWKGFKNRCLHEVSRAVTAVQVAAGRDPGSDVR